MSVVYKHLSDGVSFTVYEDRFGNLTVVTNTSVRIWTTTDDSQFVNAEFKVIPPNS